MSVQRAPSLQAMRCRWGGKKKKKGAPGMPAFGTRLISPSSLSARPAFLARGRSVLGLAACVAWRAEGPEVARGREGGRLALGGPPGGGLGPPQVKLLNGDGAAAAAAAAAGSGPGSGRAASAAASVTPLAPRAEPPPGQSGGPRRPASLPTPPDVPSSSSHPPPPRPTARARSSLR